MRIAVNLFASETGAAFVTSPERLPFFVEAAVSCVEDSEKEKEEEEAKREEEGKGKEEAARAARGAAAVQLAGSCLLHNIALRLGERKGQCEALCEGGVAVLARAVRKEWKAKGEEFARNEEDVLEERPVALDSLATLLKALGVVCLDNDVAAAVLVSLPEEGSIVDALAEMKEKPQWLPVRGIAAEILNIVEMV
ncbi:uncharacterized protein MONOS_9475 [Monocercomonoides exilis]|uniref:uncharacterized protein n=1 Tax=Monocercomonoides exilis TaxID=2049356 RepID=UPI00355A2C3A|nr:hypothetical protein MONOS_9475 [Monocercomonoides exilis]|eukprot:MONOS_9475.1-p1 / transcript=MONOS_9475.1 / gene=MONOS_9475 / organism=Monocercomonoides_exilis_PA203 / gene_product=unspecified product / transcript_product=unspecified product / location=Mono_scaffold00393:15801-16385(-) / protein_length=195 / sequence_SO=supercontig / SO=protein_coding / is_pseudo=false